MKKPYEITHCEYCNTTIKLDSPPQRKHYEAGQIDIRDATMLLPPKVVKKNTIEGVAPSHANNLSGLYCNYKCLLNEIKRLLYIK